MELSILEIWNTMGFLARAVAISLIAMGACSMAIALERFMVIERAFDRSARFARRSRPLLEADEIGDVVKLAEANDYRRTPLARLATMGLRCFQDSRGYGEEAALELSRRAFERSLEELAAEARRGMGFLASVGSTAPFIGLFGTVIGIITAFQGIASSGGGGIEAVSAGIAEALIVTAVGLIVAIFAVLVFNYLSARFDRFDMTMQHAAGEMIDHLEARHGSST